LNAVEQSESLREKSFFVYESNEKEINLITAAMGVLLIEKLAISVKSRHHACSG